MTLYFFAIVISVIACVLCTSEALSSWVEGGDMNWFMLLLGVVNGFICLMNTYFFAKDFIK